ncbi:MAG TPA: glycosyltransferase [Alphaproteobacteria bacterium]|jgi:glycosyltransferase involved in cell wall biosynthesis|nr:glycosyltransferase [Alphaproteobacteria bacterium]
MAPRAIIYAHPMQGHVDNVTRDRIEGWAWDPAEPDGVVLLKVYDNGMPIGEIIADRFRDGLKEAGIGSGCHAFDWAIPGGLSPGRSHAIEVRSYTGGWLLPGTEAALEAVAIETAGPDDRGAMQGHVDSITRDRIQGWAWDPAQPDAAVLLTVYDNGIAIGEITADRFREGLREAGIGVGRHAFNWAMPGGLSPALSHAIEVRRASDGWLLPGSEEAVAADPEAIAATALPLGGSLDICTRGMISGWAWDSTEPDRPVALQILNERSVIARVLANRYRDDLEKAGIGDGRHAFQVQIPGGLAPLERHVIRVRGARDAREIPGSPFVIEPSDSFDTALEDAVTKAIDALEGQGDHDRALAFLTDQAERILQQRADFDGARTARAAFRAFTRRGGAQAATDPGLRALVIDNDVPDAARDAGSQAILSHMRALQDLGYSVGFTAAQEECPAAAAVAQLGAAGVRLYGPPFYATPEEVLKRQRGCVDLVYLHRLSNAEKYLALARHYNPRAKLIYSVADLHHIRIARQGDIEERPELKALARRIRLAECTAAFQAGAVLTHSADEAGWLGQSVPEASVHVVPWGIDTRATGTPLAERQGLAFIAGFGHTPNVDAACYLAREIMPLIRQSGQNLPCLLAGSAMPEIVTALVGPDIEILGTVPDLDEVFSRVRLTIAPLRYGAGIKGKVLNSFAAGIPCVMTPVAAEGLALDGRLQGLIAETTEDIAALVLRLHGDTAELTALSEACLAFVREHYSDEATTAALKAAITAVR